MRKIIFLLVIIFAIALSVTYYKRKEIMASRIIQLLNKNGLAVDTLKVGFLGWNSCQIEEMTLKSQLKENDWQIKIKNAHVHYLINIESYLNIQRAEIDDLIVVMGARQDTLTEAQTNELINRYVQEMLIPALHFAIDSIKINNFEISSEKDNQSFHLKTLVDFHNQDKSLTLDGSLRNAGIFPYDQIKWQGELIIQTEPFSIVLQPSFTLAVQNYQQGDIKMASLALGLKDSLNIQWMLEQKDLAILANKINFDGKEVYWDKIKYPLLSGELSKLSFVKEKSQWKWRSDLSLTLPAHIKPATDKPSQDKKLTKLNLNMLGSSANRQHTYQLSGNIENPSIDLKNVIFDIDGTISSTAVESKAIFNKCKIDIEADKTGEYKLEPITILAKDKLSFVSKGKQNYLMPSRFEITPVNLVMDDKTLVAKTFTLALEKIELPLKMGAVKGLLQANQIAVKWQDFDVPDIDLKIDFAWQKQAIQSNWTFLKPLKLGLDLNQLAFALNIDSREPVYEYAVHNMQAKIFGGDIQSEAILIKDKKLVQAFKLIFTNMQIDQLFAWRKVDGLSGTGAVDGILPCFVTENGFEIKGGSFAAKTPGGRISYVPANRTKSDIAGMEIAFKALQDFQYSELNAKVEYKTDGWMNLALFLKGKSDLLGKDRPVEFNLNLDENVKDLLKSTALINKYSRVDYMKNFQREQM